MNGRFETTRWSLILAAREGSGPGAAEALASLCEAYWRPVYAFIRRRGSNPEEAKDLTQSYFTLLLEKSYLEDVSPERGRFRSFLLKSVQHFLSNERDRERAAKRGGARTPIAFDALEAERRLALEPRDERTPEAEFERAWAMAVLERAMARLAEEARHRDRAKQFALLAPLLTDASGDRPYREMAEELKVSESAVKVAVHRLRRRFGELLREEILGTLREPGDVDDELRHLLAVVAA